MQNIPFLAAPIVTSVASFFILEKFYLSKKLHTPVRYIFSITIGLVTLTVLRSLFGILGFLELLPDVLFSFLSLYFCQKYPNSKKVIFIFLIYNIFCIIIGYYGYMKFHNKVSQGLLYESYLVLTLRFSIVCFTLYHLLKKNLVR